MSAVAFQKSIFLHHELLHRNITIDSIENRRRKSFLTKTKRPRFNIHARFPNDKPTLVFITPDGITRCWEKANFLCESVLRTPSTIVQVRDTTAKEQDIAELVASLLDAGFPPSRLVVNGLSYATAASLHDNLGFHMKERDATKGAMVLNHLDVSKRLIGCAVHSVHSARAFLRLHNLDYMQVGTMYKSLSHPGKTPEGPVLLEKIRALDIFPGTKTKLICVGGVNLENASSLIKHGAHGVAVIRAISDADDPRATTIEFMRILNQAGSQDSHRLEK